MINVSEVKVDLIIKNIPGLGNLEATLLYVNPVTGNKLCHYKQFLYVVDKDNNFIRFSETLSAI